MMGYAIQKRGCHLGIAEDRDPFAELQVRIAVLNGYTALGIPVTEAVG